MLVSLVRFQPSAPLDRSTIKPSLAALRAAPSGACATAAQPRKAHLYFAARSAIFPLVLSIALWYVHRNSMEHTPAHPVAASRAVRTNKGSVAPRPARSTAFDERPKLPPRHPHNPWIGRVLVFAICVLGADGLFGERSLAEGMRARRDYEAAAGAMHRLKQENTRLREQVRALREDGRTIESVARRELGLIRPGEILVTVRDHRRPRTSPSSSTSATHSSTSATRSSTFATATH